MRVEMSYFWRLSDFRSGTINSCLFVSARLFFVERSSETNKSAGSVFLRADKKHSHWEIEWSRDERERAIDNASSESRLG
jgi:hypothetical protein